MEGMLSKKLLRKIVCSGRRRLSSPSSSPSPPPSLSRVVEEEALLLGKRKSICFWGFNDQQQMEWYNFNVSFIMHENTKKRKRHHRFHHHGNGRSRSTPPLLMPFSVSEGVTTDTDCCVAVGSMLYRFCTDGKFSKSVRCIDVRNLDSGCWKKCAQMINRRYGPSVAVLDGKIYVMGGSHLQKSGPWAEVYDRCLDKWETLPSPPCIACPSFIAAIDASKKILVHLSELKVMYVYDVRTKSWEEVTDMPAHFCRGRTTVIDQTVYWCNGFNTLNAFDLENRIYFSGVVKGLEKDCIMYSEWEGSYVTSTLLHLDGDEFCLFWVDDVDLPTLSHCVKIRVSKCDHSDSSSGGDGRLSFLDASVLSCQSFTLGHNITTSIDAVMLDGRFTWKKMLEDESASAEVVGKISAGLTDIISGSGLATSH